jgi:hypothetical protein
MPSVWWLACFWRTGWSSTPPLGVADSDLPTSYRPTVAPLPASCGLRTPLFGPDLYCRFYDVVRQRRSDGPLTGQGGLVAKGT